MKRGIFLAVLAAVLYALNAPFSKILLDYIPPTLMAGLLYLGAGIGMVVISEIRIAEKKKEHEKKLSRADLPYTIAMIVLDIIAPVCLMNGLALTTAANAALLNNFEIVATALIAWLLFKEKIGGRLWSGILFVTISCCILSFEGSSSLQFSIGSLFVLAAAACWGLENNCTRKLSDKDPLEIVLLKGIFSGSGSIIIGLLIHERITNWWCVPLVLLVGFAAYGLSIYFYVYAQRYIGAARTSAYYAIAPFVSSILSLVIFREIPGLSYLIALVFMAIGAWLCGDDGPLFSAIRKKHKQTCKEKNS